MTANSLSEKLLLATKLNQETQTLRDLLGLLSIDELLIELKGDTHKKSFWINIYNSYFVIFRKELQYPKTGIYHRKEINIARRNFTLDEVEHGILRRNKFKFSLGYIRNPFASSILKKLAVNKLDPRIHFALNCGAKSCPPIAFYSPDKIETQLQLATLSFIEGETEIKSNTVYASKIFKWYQGDFGGNRGIKKLISDTLNKDLSKATLRYVDYSFEEDLDNYIESSF